MASDEIQPATMDQVVRGRDGKMLLIKDDVGGVAADLKAIDDTLCLRYSVAGQYFVVYYRYTRPDGSEKEELVLTAQECDQRIVNRVREIDAEGRSGYNFAKELQKHDDKRRDNALAASRERQREQAERAYHRIRKQQGVKTRIFVP